MSYPLYPDKHEHPAVTHPGELYGPDETVPESVVVCFQPPVYEYAVEAHAGRAVDPDAPRHDLAVLEGAEGSVGAVSVGIGGPAAARVLEELIARGVGAILLVGHAGGLQRDVAVGDVVVAERALRDEGTSYHYLEPARTVAASASLSDAVADAARDATTVHRGATWTVDAIFRETPPEVERHAATGVLTVDMEAASSFAVAAHRDVEAAAAFVVSDYVGPDDWEGRIEETWPHLEALVDRAVEALAARPR